MCEPITLTAGTLATAQLAVAGASAAAGVVGAIQSTNAQNERSATTAANAKEAYFLKASQINSRIRQEGVASQQKKEDARLKSLRSQGAAKAAAAAGNVKGRSVDALLADYQRSEGRFNDRANQQLEATTTSLRFDQVGAQKQADQRIASVPPAGMENIFGAVLEGGGKVFSAYSGYNDTISGEG